MPSAASRAKCSSACARRGSDRSCRIAVAELGILFVALLLWAEKSGDPAKLAFAATMLAFVLRFPRDELVGVIRPVVWYALLPYLSVVLTPVLMSGALRTMPFSTRQRVPSSEVA